MPEVKVTTFAPKFTTTAYASVTFNIAARVNAARAAVLDDPNQVYGLPVAGPEFSDRANELQAAALGAVVSSYMATEAILNELYMESSLHEPGLNFNGMHPEVAVALLDSWNNGADRWPIVTMCHAATAICGVAPLDFGGGAPQQFLRLTRLRHTLTHHKLVSVEAGKAVAYSDDKLERDLNGAFASARIWAGRGATFRWAGCLGAGCAQWAYQTTVDFQAHRRPPAFSSGMI